MGRRVALEGIEKLAGRRFSEDSPPPALLDPNPIAFLPGAVGVLLRPVALRAVYGVFVARDASWRGRGAVRRPRRDG